MSASRFDSLVSCLQPFFYCSHQRMHRMSTDVNQRPSIILQFLGAGGAGGLGNRLQQLATS